MLIVFAHLSHPAPDRDRSSTTDRRRPQVPTSTTDECIDLTREDDDENDVAPTVPSNKDARHPSEEEIDRLAGDEEVDELASRSSSKSTPAQLDAFTTAPRGYYNAFAADPLLGSEIEKICQTKVPPSSGTIVVNWKKDNAQASQTKHMVTEAVDAPIRVDETKQAQKTTSKPITSLFVATKTTPGKKDLFRFTAEDKRASTTAVRNAVKNTVAQQKVINENTAPTAIPSQAKGDHRPRQQVPFALTPEAVLPRTPAELRMQESLMEAYANAAAPRAAMPSSQVTNTPDDRPPVAQQPPEIMSPATSGTSKQFRHTPIPAPRCHKDVKATRCKVKKALKRSSNELLELQAKRKQLKKKRYTLNQRERRLDEQEAELMIQREDLVARQQELDAKEEDLTLRE
jgi:hypothetical protein